MNGAEKYEEAKKRCSTKVERMCLELYIELQNDYLSVLSISMDKFPSLYADGDPEKQDRALRLMNEMTVVGQMIWNNEICNSS